MGLPIAASAVRAPASPAQRCSLDLRWEAIGGSADAPGGSADAPGEERRNAPPDLQLERETGFEPATPSLEGWRSTAELFPRMSVSLAVVGRGGFEPPKAFASRFTVCPLWPLGYLPGLGMSMRTP